MTINDIARICGVSKGTVNRALHNKPGINVRTKALILSAVEEHDFHPDYRAKSLATGKTHTIGLLLPNIENQAFAGISTFIEREFWKHGYLLNLALSNDDASKEERYLELFMNRKIDGLVIFPVNRESIGVQRVIDAGIPTILLMNDLPSIKTNTILIDERKAFTAITRYILSLGHRNIVYIDGYRQYTDRYNDYINKERYAGFIQALNEYKIDPATTRCLEFDPNNYTYGNLGPLMEYFGGPHGASAAICFHDRIAIWLMGRLQRANIRVPEDVSVTGFDDVAELQDIKPGLTTLHNPYSHIAHGLIRLLLAQIELGEQKISRILLDADLIVRESCKSLN